MKRSCASLVGRLVSRWWAARLSTQRLCICPRSLLRLPIYLRLPMYLAITMGLSIIPGHSIAMARAAPPHSTPIADTVRINELSEILKLWTPNSGLYVTGDVPFENPNELSDWLKAYPNWTVYLVNKSQGLSFRDSEGLDHHHNQAVEFALSALRRKKDFRDILHPKTEERYGAILFISFDEVREYRGVAYLASEAFDSRGLGESSWMDTLDQLALAPLKDGMRVFDAVTDTISTIERRLASALSQQASALSKQASQATAILDSARAQLKKASIERENLQVELYRFRDRFPKLRGELVYPNLDSVEDKLAIASRAIDQGNPTTAQRDIEAARNRLAGYRQQVNDYVATGDSIGNLEGRFHALNQNPSADKVTLEQATRVFQGAKSRYERGDLSFRTDIARAEQSVTALENAIRVNEFLERENSRRKAVARTRNGLLSLFAAISIALVGFVASRKRKSIKDQTLKSLVLWERALDEKQTVLLDLDHRKSRVIGESPDDSPFSGETLKLSRLVSRDLDHLLILLVSARDILDRAKKAAHPISLWGRVRNLFSRAQYAAVLRQLTRTPISFDPKSGLATAMRGEFSMEKRLTGKLEDYAPFALSFTDLIEEFNRKGSSALSSLELIDHAHVSVGENLSQLKTQIDDFRMRLDALGKPGQEDGLFLLPQGYSRSLVQAQKVYQQSDASCLNDPVNAQRDAESCLEILCRSESVVAVVERFREHTIVEINELEETLERQPGAYAWIDNALSAASSKAGILVAQSVDEPIASSLELLEKDLEDLKNSVQRASDLDRKRRHDYAIAIDQLHAEINMARTRLGQALNLDPERTLREGGDDPSDFRIEALRSNEALAIALQSGNSVAAQDHAATVEDSLRIVRRILEESFAQLDRHPKDVSELRGAIEVARQCIPKAERELSLLKTEYIESALVTPDGSFRNESVVDNIARAQKALDRSNEVLATSETFMTEARILEAAACRDQARALHEIASLRLNNIHHTRKALAKLERENSRRLEEMRQKELEFETQNEDPRTTRSTQGVYEAWRSSWLSIHQRIAAEKRNPSEFQRRLSMIEEESLALSESIRLDWEMNAACGQALDYTKAQVECAHRAAQATRGDQVGDSRLVVEAYQELDAVRSRLSSMEREYEIPHGSWSHIIDQAQPIASTCERLVVILRDELDKAARALEQITSAARMVRVAQFQSFAFAVRINGSPGSRSLSLARKNLQQGLYDTASDLSRRALSEAEAAIATAESQVRQAREAKRRSDQARRREVQRRRSRIDVSQMNSSTSGWSASSSSFSKGGSGFASSIISSPSSGKSPSNSGFSSSNW